MFPSLLHTILSINMDAMGNTCIKLPPKDEMLTNIGVWVEKAKEAVEDHYYLMEFMKEYFRHMNETMGYSQASMDLQNSNKTVVDMDENICTWRDKQYRCVHLLIYPCDIQK